MLPAEYFWARHSREVKVFFVLTEGVWKCWKDCNALLPGVLVQFFQVLCRVTW